MSHTPKADPHPTGLPPRLTSLHGFLFAVFQSDGLPLLLRQPGSALTLLPVFSTPEKLQAALTTWIKPGEPWKIKQVTDMQELLESCAEEYITVAADPYLHNGNTRWTGFIPDPSPNN